MLVAAIAGAWLVLMFALMAIWSQVHVDTRMAEGIDEELYVNGLDERSLYETA
jgi:hypothetical protein